MNKSSSVESQPESDPKPEQKIRETSGVGADIR